MENKSPEKTISRRQFLTGGARLTATAAIMSMGGASLMARALSNLTEVDIPYTKLNNGTLMPRLGFGTHTLRGDTCIRCVSEAIDSGYRLIDTATIYGNEEFVGQGIKKSGFDRDKLFVTSKLWVDDAGYENTLKAFQVTLDKLQLDYLNLWLIHRPRGDVRGTWKAMEELYHAGKVKAIGLSNFAPKDIEDVLSYCTVKPVINQVENHAFFQQTDIAKSLKKNGIQMEGWSPFAQGRNGMFTNETIAAIAKKYNKTNAQVCLRWQFQHGLVIIPRTTQKAHMEENLQIFDFKLSGGDMKVMDSLNLDKTQFPEWE